MSNVFDEGLNRLRKGGVNPHPPKDAKVPPPPPSQVRKSKPMDNELRDIFWTLMVSLAARKQQPRINDMSDFEKGLDHLLNGECPMCHCSLFDHDSECSKTWIFPEPELPSSSKEGKIPNVDINMGQPFPGCFTWETECMKCSESIRAPLRVDMPKAPYPILCNDCGGKGWVLVSQVTEMARESLAAVQHEIWSHWMRWILSQCRERSEPILDFGGKYDPDNDPHGFGPLPSITGEEIEAIILPKTLKRWKRKMNTPYADLSEEWKESDRHQADKVLAALEGK